MLIDKVEINTFHKVHYLLDSKFPLKEGVYFSTQNHIALTPLQWKNLLVILREKTSKVWGGFAKIQDSLPTYPPLYSSMVGLRG